VAKLQFHPEAEAEYSDAVLWYEERSPRASARFEVEVERALDRILEAPHSFPRYDAIHRFALVRRFPYSAVYQITEGTVYVVAMAHSSRSPGYWKNRVS
jgi:plasmid stabilization system protein ParE